MTLEEKFDELDAKGVVCWEGIPPRDGDYDAVFRIISSGDCVRPVKAAWLFQDSLGQVLAVAWDDRGGEHV